MSSATEKIMEEDEINLLALAKVIWKKKSQIFWTVFLFAVLGVVFVLLSPKEYSSQTIMVPQTQSSGNKMGGLAGLAAMAGISADLNTRGETLSPLVYPQVLNSGPFQRELMNQAFVMEGFDAPLSLLEYYTHHAKTSPLTLIKTYTVGLPGLILGAFKEKPSTAGATPIAFRFTKEEEEVSKNILERLNLQVDTKNGYISLTSTFHDPLLAAQVADFSRNLLEQYIVRFKTKKAKEELEFIQNLYKEKEADFLKSQRRLASFKDQNQFARTAISRADEERMQSQFSISSSVYMEMAKQLEQAKIKVKEETPVFVVVEPAQVPLEKSKPKSLLVLVIFCILGGIISLAFIFFKEFIGGLKEEWEKA